MNCQECQWNIASEENGLEIREHLAHCENCTRYAAELAENAAALRAIEPDLAAYAAVRARVMEAVRPKRRFVRWWAPALAGAVGLVMVLWVNTIVPRSWPAPAVVSYRVAPPANWAMTRSRPNDNRRRVANLAHMPTVARRRAVHNEPQLTAIKMLTDDPNVVIIWLVDKEKGDSL